MNRKIVMTSYLTQRTDPQNLDKPWVPNDAYEKNVTCVLTPGGPS